MANSDGKKHRIGNVSTTDPEQAAASAGLRYVTDASPGIRRKRKGAGFVFHGPDGKRVNDRNEIRRIQALVIPPAWKNVWICARDNGHLQATGIDAKGRKQYKYHPRWRSVRDEAKFDRLLAFSQKLPKIRAQVRKDLRNIDLTREKVIATVVRLLEVSLIRIGNEEYAKENKSFGLTTMRNRHVAVKGSTVRFQFRGKGGKEHSLEVSDERIARVVKKCQALPGQHLFEYRTANGEIESIGSEDVNDYLQQIAGEPFTAKDFRTWAGTVLAAIALSKLVEFDTHALAKKNVVTAIEAVAKLLGNTPAICRKCYIHPAVADSYLNGTLIQVLREKAENRLSRHLHRLKPEEAAVVALLRQELAARSRKKAA